MDFEVAIHRWIFEDKKEKIQEHAAQLSGMFNAGWTFVCQSVIPDESPVLILTTFKRNIAKTETHNNVTT